MNCPICNSELVANDVNNYLDCPTKVQVFPDGKMSTHYCFYEQDPYETYIIQGSQYKYIHEIITVMPYQLCSNFGDNTTAISKYVDPNDEDAGFSYRSGIRHFQRIAEVPLIRYSNNLVDRINTLLPFI